MWDLVLQGVGDHEFEALYNVANVPGYTPPGPVADRLKAKGWLEVIGDTQLITLTGRTLLDSPTPARHSRNLQ